MAKQTVADLDETAPATRSAASEVEWWEAPEIDTVEGNDLIRDDALFTLVGVPFLITKLVFRAGVQRQGSPWRDDYVSAELRVAPQQVITKEFSRILARRTGKLITDKTNIATPGEFLIINDGSTGFYRQIMQYLEAKGLITLPDLPPDGPKGECRYDLPRDHWASGVPEDDTFVVALRCPRGLRYSDYENEYTAPGQSALTWYIA